MMPHLVYLTIYALIVVDAHIFQICVHINLEKENLHGFQKELRCILTPMDLTHFGYQKRKFSKLCRLHFEKECGFSRHMIWSYYEFQLSLPNVGNATLGEVS